MLKNKTIVKVLSIAVLLAFLIVSIISIFPHFGAGAKTAQERIDDAQKKQEELKKDIDAAKGEREVSIAAKEVIDREIAALQTDIDSLNARIAESDRKIAAQEAELQKAQEECDKQYASYCDRAELLLERGSVSYLEILIKADSFEDFLTRAALVQEIAEYDNNKLQTLKKYAEQVKTLKEELEAEKASVVALKADADAKMDTLESKRAQSQSIIDSLSGDIAEYEKALAAQEKAEAAARAEIARLSSGSSSASTPYTGGAFKWPSTSSYITSSYGTRTHPVTGKIKTHTGIDIGAAHGTDIYAAADGTVLISGWNAGGYGNYVVIDHGGGLTTLYAHCSSLLVSSGQKVTRGQVIAKCGSTGMSTGPHIHFEVLKNGAHTNPMAYFN
jgi:murein DD-endopeptidase MepM/ murein hydrolase activator NlpD